MTHTQRAHNILRSQAATWAVTIAMIVAALFIFISGSLAGPVSDIDNSTSSEGTDDQDLTLSAGDQESTTLPSALPIKEDEKNRTTGSISITTSNVDPKDVDMDVNGEDIDVPQSGNVDEVIETDEGSMRILFNISNSNADDPDTRSRIRIDFDTDSDIDVDQRIKYEEEVRN